MVALLTSNMGSALSDAAASAIKSVRKVEKVLEKAVKDSTLMQASIATENPWQQVKEAIKNYAKTALPARRAEMQEHETEWRATMAEKSDAIM